MAGRTTRPASSREVTDAYERYWTPGDHRARSSAFVDDLSNWYIRRSRRRFWAGDEAALRTLWDALVQATRVIAPVMPFLAEHLWRNLVAGRAATAVGFLAGWPDAGDAGDDEMLAEIAETRQRRRARAAGARAGRA